MSFLVKHKAEFYQKRSGDKITVELLKDGYSGAVNTIQAYGADPLRIDSIDSAREADKVVVGSSADFTFWVSVPASQKINTLSSYQDLITSDYKEWKLKVKRDDVLVWEGWVQPDLISHSILDNKIAIRLSATDGLKDLKDFEFRGSLRSASGWEPRWPIIRVIKSALNEVGIVLDFSCQLNLRHQDGSSLVNALTDSYIDIRRFENNVDGKLEYDNCELVIEKVLTPFNCTLRQSKGRYWIQSLAEKETAYWNIDWSTLTGVKQTAITAIDISDEKFQRGGELSKITPVKTLRAYQMQSRLGEQVLAYDINNYANWTISFPDATVESSSTILIIQRAQQSEDIGEFFEGSMLSNNINIDQFSEGDYLRLDFSFMAFLRINAICRLRVTLLYEGEAEVVTDYQDMTEDTDSFIVLPNDFRFPIIGEGNYQFKVEFLVIVNDGSTSSGFPVDFAFTLYAWGFDVLAYRIDTMQDILHTARQDGKRIVDKELWISDGAFIADRYVITTQEGFVSSAWSYLTTKSLLSHFIADFLRINSTYRDYLKLTVHKDSINETDTIKIGSDYYRIASYTWNVIDKTVDLVLREYIAAESPFEVNEKELTLSDSSSQPAFGVEHDGLFPIDYLTWDSQRITDIPKLSGVVAGGNITSIGDGLKIAVSDVAYYVDGVLRVLNRSTELELDAGDGSDRVDMIVANRDGDVFIRKGSTERNRITEVEIGRITVEAGQTVIPAPEIIYDENTEWTASSQVLTADFDNLTDPFRGAKAIKVENWDNGKLIFEPATAFDASDVDVLGFAIKLLSDWNTSDKILIRVFDGASFREYERTFPGTRAGYSVIGIPWVNWGVENVTKIEFELTSRGTDRPGFFLDYITLQTNEDVRQPEVPDSHTRQHFMDSGDDHAPSSEADRGRLIRANPTTGSIEFFEHDFAIEEDVKKYAGFENRTDSVIAMSGNNFQITTPISYNIWINGAGKQTITETLSIEITDDQVLTYVYLDMDGANVRINKSTSAWNISDGTAIPLAIVFKDGIVYAVTDERHGHNRNLDWHTWAHLTIGAMYRSGLAGSFADAAALLIGGGVIFDEDIQFTIPPDQTTTSLWYRNATSGMRLVRGSTRAYSYLGNNIQWDNGSGTLQEVGNNNYYASWVYASNDPFEPIYTVIGQGNHTTLNAARGEGQPIINLSTAEWKLLYKVIYRNTPTPSFIEAVDYRTVQTGVPTTASTPNSHTALIDRDAADSHPIEAITGLAPQLHPRLHSITSLDDHETEVEHANKVTGWDADGKPAAKEAGELPEQELISQEQKIEHPILIGNESYLASAYAILQAIQANVAGLNPKEEVHAATTENIALTGLQTIDTVVLVANNRVLVKDQTNASENGIYLVASGAWVRSADADTYDKHAAAYVLVNCGDENRHMGYYCTAETGGTLGTTDIEWIVFSRPGDYDIVNVGGGAAIFKTQDGFTFKLRTLSSSDATFTEVGDEVNMALLGVEATMNNHFVQELTPDVDLKEEGDTWTRPSDLRTFELYVDGLTRYWIERTSPKIL